MGALKLTYQLEKHTPNLRIAYKSVYVNQREPETKELEKLRLYYCVFGMIMPGRNYNSTEYRFGFQGQEKDDEITGQTGSHLAFKYRVHDARIGRFLSIDPLTAKYPHNSPYAFSENRVIDKIELEGLESHPHKFNFNYFRNIQEGYFMKGLADLFTAPFQIFTAKSEVYAKVAHGVSANSKKRTVKSTIVNKYSLSLNFDFSEIKYTGSNEINLTKPVIHVENKSETYIENEISTEFNMFRVPFIARFIDRNNGEGSTSQSTSAGVGTKNASVNVSYTETTEDGKTEKSVSVGASGEKTIPVSSTTSVGVGGSAKIKAKIE